MEQHRGHWPHPSAPSPGAGATILIVEDQTALRALMQRVLEQRGYHVLAAGTAAEAVGLAAEAPGPIALLLLDAMLPDLPGAALADELHPFAPAAQLVFISGHAPEDLAHSALLPKEAIFLQKPFELDAFTGVVDALLKP